MYFKGQGISQDKSKAEEYFKKVVVSKGNVQDKAESYYMLGIIYSESSPDYSNYYKFGTLHGVFSTQDYSQAVEYFQKAADMGYAMAYFKLGGLYYYGWKGLPANPKKAEECYDKACDMGIEEACKIAEDIRRSNPCQ